MLGELTLYLTLTRCKPIYLITSAQSRSFVAFALHRRVELPSCLVGLKLAAGGNQMRWVPARAILYGLRPHLRWPHLPWLLNTAQANAGRSRRHVPHARAARGEPHLLTLTPTMTLVPALALIRRASPTFARAASVRRVPSRPVTADGAAT